MCTHHTRIEFCKEPWLSKPKPAEYFFHILLARSDPIFFSYTNGPAQPVFVLEIEISSLRLSTYILIIKYELVSQAWPRQLTPSVLTGARSEHGSSTYHIMVGGRVALSSRVARRYDVSTTVPARDACALSKSIYGWDRWRCERS